jgi:hypothetical protein
VAVGRELTEDDVFLAQDGLCLTLSQLSCEDGHLLVGCFEDGGLPEIIFFPDLALIDLWDLIKQSFGFVLVPIKGED